MRKLNEPEASDGDLATIVSLDPVISSRLLRLANGAYYGFPARINTVSQAISVIGRKALSNLVLGMAVIGSTDRLDIPVRETRRHWQHSLLCALTTRRLGRALGYRGDGESLFVAGLLHDIGRLVIWHGAPEAASALWGQVREETARSVNLVLEVERLGIDHTRMGEALLKQWALPDLLVEGARWHHDHERATLCREELRILYLANLMSHSASNVGDVESLVAEEPLFAVLGLDVATVRQVMDDSAAEFAELLDLFLWS